LATTSHEVLLLLNRMPERCALHRWTKFIAGTDVSNVHGSLREEEAEGRSDEAISKVSVRMKGRFKSFEK
jgi:hypothetical protein